VREEGLVPGGLGSVTGEVGVLQQLQSSWVRQWRDGVGHWIPAIKKSLQKEMINNSFGDGAHAIAPAAGSTDMEMTVYVYVFATHYATALRGTRGVLASQTSLLLASSTSMWM
jgi:hypothetical protein